MHASRFPSPLCGRAPRPGPGLLVALAWLLVPLPAPAAQEVPATLTLEEALELARRHSPSLAAARNDEDVADWDVRSAYGTLLVPSASVSTGMSWQGSGEQRFGSLTTGQLGFGNLPSYYFSSYNLGLSYNLSGATLLAPGRARAARDATVAGVRDREAALIRDVTRAYLDALRQEEGLRLAEQELERTRHNLRLAEGRLAVEAATALDVRQAEVAVGRAEVGRIQAENAVHTAHLRLLLGMGVSLDSEVRLVEPFQVQVSEPPWTRQELMDLALRRNPSLEAARRRQDVSAVGVRSARSAYFPSLSLQAGITGFTREASDGNFLVRQAEAQADQQVLQCQAINELFVRLADPLPTQDCSVFQLTDGDRRSILKQNSAFPFDFTRSPTQVSLTVSLPVFQGLTRQRDLEAARASREDARLEVRERELALGAEVGATLAALRTAYRTAVLEERTQEVADAQLHLAREQYEVGLVSFLELVEAETVKARADRERVAAVFTYHEALADLEALVGAPLRTR